ncbi:unnamed protein product [Prunus armeniaca]
MAGSGRNFNPKSGQTLSYKLNHLGYKLIKSYPTISQSKKRLEVGGGGRSGWEAGVVAVHSSLGPWPVAARGYAGGLGKT